MELFKHMAGVDIVHVPYKGTAAVVTALVTGQVQISFALSIRGHIGPFDSRHNEAT